VVVVIVVAGVVVRVAVMVLLEVENGGQTII